MYVLQTFVRDSKLSFSKFKTDIDSSKSWRLSPAKPIGTTCSVASLLAATLHQGNSDRNYKLWNIGSTEIYTPCAGDLGMLLHITMGKFKSLLSLKLHS
jgi:hypothetical protein